ncbi:MAG: SMC-Scp complex subunit ScpB [Thermoplasmata archaeon]
MPKPERVVEAALFSAGRPVSVEELREATGLEADVIRSALKKLIRSSKKRDSAIEVVRAGAKYCMQVRKELVPSVTKLAKTDIPRRLLKTLALIAYHQPVKQSALLAMVGPKVYDHVKELHKLGMILESPSGQTKILTTSARFPEYFGIKTTKREEIKKWMAESVGIKTDGTLVGAKPAPEILATPPAEGTGGEREAASGAGEEEKKGASEGAGEREKAKEVPGGGGEGVEKSSEVVGLGIEREERESGEKVETEAKKESSAAGGAGAGGGRGGDGGQILISPVASRRERQEGEGEGKGEEE